jgi:serine/threonine protein kinase
VADEKEEMRKKNHEKSMEMLKLAENAEVITSLAFLSVSKGDFVRQNRGLFEDFYAIGPILGIGTFSEVRKCESKVTNQWRAVKVINKKHLHNQDSLKRFLYEI